MERPVFSFSRRDGLRFDECYLASGHRHSAGHDGGRPRCRDREPASRDPARRRDPPRCGATWTATTFIAKHQLPGFPKFPAQGASDCGRRDRMPCYATSTTPPTTSPAATANSCAAGGIAGSRARHRMFAVVPEQVVPLGMLALGRVLLRGAAPARAASRRVAARARSCRAGSPPWSKRVRRAGACCAGRGHRRARCPDA